MQRLNCSAAADRKLKTLAVWRSQGISNGRGPHMNNEIIEIIIAVGLVFAAASLGRLAYERQMDVLHGPYIEGRNTQPVLRTIAKPLLSLVDRLRFKLRGMIYLASIVAC